MQALMQYANGNNPQVPPFLALGELNRRKKMQEGAAADQAREMEGAPTVKQQIEQAAGLMALQGNRQRQAAQQQAGVQAGMPMAAPNTTTSEPAQLAGGGFIDDIVVPRDYAPGGSVVDPEDLKSRMLRETMQMDVQDIPKELMSAVARAALRRRPGIAGVPLPTNMFKRSDYAGGGIVAFAGPEGSFVETRPGFYELESEAKNEEKPAGLDDMYRNLIQRQMQRKSLQERIKEANLERPPEAAREEFAELQRSLQEQKARAPMEQLEQLLLGISEARGGTFGTQGAAGAQRSMETEARQRAGITAINQQMAKIKDLREKAAYDAARGNIEKSAAEEQAADKELADLFSKMSRSRQESALAEQALAGRTATDDRAAQAYLQSRRALGDTRPDAVILDEGYMRVLGARGSSLFRAQTGAYQADVNAVNMARDNVDNRLKDVKSKEFRELFRLQAEDRKNGTNKADEYKQRLYADELAAIQGRSQQPQSGGSAGAPPPPPPGFKPVQ